MLHDRNLPARQTSPDDRPRLSVVVIGRNEGPRLQRCLSSIEMIELPPDEVEVIYVDSGSADGSVARAQEAGARVVEWPSDYATPGGARNRGWAAASAQYVLFLDADCTLEPGFARRALTELEDPKVAIAFGIIYNAARIALSSCSPGGGIENMLAEEPLRWRGDLPR